VERRGENEDWAGCRQDVDLNVETIITAKIVDERVAINDKHQKQYAAIQAYIHTYMIAINNYNRHINDKRHSR